MRMLISLLFLLMFSVCPVQAADVPTGTQDMLHLDVQATGVRLRAGAGTEFAIVGMASREKEMSRYFIAYATPSMDSEGRPWFRLLAKIERQELPKHPAALRKGDLRSPVRHTTQAPGRTP